MPKSYDDPEEEDPIDRARRQREAAEKASRITHEAWEPTDPPPPIETPWPTVEGITTTSTRSSDPPRHVRRLGNWGKYFAGMVAGGVALYTVGAPIVTWIVTRPAQTELAELKRGCDATAAASAIAATVPLTQRIADLEAKVKRDGQRWDAHDKWLRQQFQRRNAPPVCQFGPKAESRGNACTLEELDTP